MNHCLLTCLLETRCNVVLLLLDLNRYSSCFLSKSTGSSRAQMVWSPKRVILGSGANVWSSLQWSFSIWLLMVAPGGDEKGKGGGGGGGGGRGARADGPPKDSLLAEGVPSSSVLSSSSHRSEKSKVLSRRCSAGLRKELHDCSESQVRRFSLVSSDLFILIFFFVVCDSREGDSQLKL